VRVFLIDTNCWIQLVRQRTQMGEVQALLAAVPTARLFVTIYSVHSIGIIMHRYGALSSYADFLNQTGIGTTLHTVDVPLSQLSRVADASAAHRLDFDDAYQYAAAELHNLALVSLDADFDRTPRGRLTPAAALQQFMDEQRRQQTGQQPPQPGTPPP
jgi:predicted nucleic acid-binding protein